MFFFYHQKCRVPAKAPSKPALMARGICDRYLPDLRSHADRSTFMMSDHIGQSGMEVKDKVYKAYVKEKEEAKAVYDQAVQAGQFAGHVALDARDSNQFSVSVNIEAHGKVTFNLTYEQLLSRNLGVYTNTININPSQIVEDMSVTVNIEEPTAIKDLEVPELQISNEVVVDKPNSLAKIDEKSPTHKVVVWAPTPEEQKSQNATGLSGQFVVKYDVDRESNPQQILNPSYPTLTGPGRGRNGQKVG
ncbi:hyaluronan metabolic process [Homalodisca vitripennis]|nr:hyaluronan metabolic process [Homalodisca vitripennis]